ncbi:MAG: hypothetical protein IKB96_05365 [Prevotella sp.]|nr:hypothetical protein [Prevotella sp.]
MPHKNIVIPHNEPISQSNRTEGNTMVVIREMRRSEMDNALDFTDCTFHAYERLERLERTASGIGEVESGFLTDKHHANGLEEHFITTEGFIIVRNHRTGRFITPLVARPGQIRRYYRAVGKTAPQWLLDKAYVNAVVCQLNYS